MSIVKLFMIGFDLRERKRERQLANKSVTRVGKEEITLGKRASTEKLFNSFKTNCKQYVSSKQTKKNSISLRVEFI